MPDLNSPPEFNQPSSLIGQLYLNVVSRKRFRVFGEDGTDYLLEGIDCRSQRVSKAILVNSDTWQRVI